MTMQIGFDQIKPIPGPFFDTEGAPASPALRQSGRAFFGLASAHGQQVDGSVTGGSWVQSITSPGSVNPVTEWDYFEDQARVASVSNFGLALSGVSRTNGNSQAIGVVGAVLNDYAPAPINAWGAYLDGVKLAAGNSVTHGVEVEAANIPGPSPLGGMDPYKSVAPGYISALSVGAGSDAAKWGRSYAIDNYIQMGNNGAAAWAGIVFRFDAIMREGVADDTTSPGNSGYARAISMAFQQGLSWYSRDLLSVTAGSFVTGQEYTITSVGTTDFTTIGAASNTVGVTFTATGAGSGTGTANLVNSRAEVMRHTVEITNAAHRASFGFRDTGMFYRERSGSGHDILRAIYNADTAVGLQIEPGTAAAPNVRFLGFSESGVTNGNMTFAPLGLGSVAITLANVRDFADDTAAAAATPAVPVGGVYRTGSNLKIRVA